MGEYLRSIEIKVEIDTNKDTYRGTFSSLEEVRKFISEVMGGPDYE